MGELRCSKQLGEEKRKLKQLVADLSLDNLMSQHVPPKKLQALAGGVNQCGTSKPATR